MVMIIIIMVIFKRLSLKAFYKIMKGEGGGVTKIITQMFLLDSA